MTIIWLVVSKGRTISLEDFCEFYGIECVADEKAETTSIILPDETIVLTWGRKYAECRETGKRIKLSMPVVHRTCNNRYYRCSAPGPYTYVSVSFLQKAGLLISRSPDSFCSL